MKPALSVWFILFVVMVLIAMKVLDSGGATHECAAQLTQKSAGDDPLPVRWVL